ncbi:MAG TPA: cupin domain-containing protein [Spirochaetota bacterium]|nr:cupin domain-containing protein [Spirochaetota bacterium]
MFAKGSEIKAVDIVQGITMKTTVFGEHTLMTEFHLVKGVTLPSHCHPHEQTGYLVSGKLILRVGNEEFSVDPGDSWCVPGNVPHSAVAIEESTAIEVFSPVREDYLPSAGK